MELNIEFGRRVRRENFYLGVENVLLDLSRALDGVKA